MSALSILVIDDDATIRDTLAEFFDALGMRARVASSGSEARRLASVEAPDVAIVDLRLPDADGLTVQHALRADDPELAVILLTGHADVATAVRAMREGAADFLEKPVDLETLEASVRRAAEVARLRRELAVLRARGVAEEPAASAAPHADTLAAVERLVDIAAKNAEAPVLITGETGTGKGFAARRIHDRSALSGEPFIEINCASLSSTFFESELFGHEKGAFTDARQAKRGLIEVAGHGTLFLDEVGELPLDVQPRLLKVLEDRTFRRLGGTTELRAECRIIAATNRDLGACAERGTFRRDLLYRLQVLSFEVPPIREHPQELERLTVALLPRGAALSPSAREAIRTYEWPGNIRELKNALWRASLLADGRAITPDDLGLRRGASVSDGGAGAPAGARTLAEAEESAVRDALRAAAGNKARAATILGIARSTLNEKLRRIESRSDRD